MKFNLLFYIKTTLTHFQILGRVVNCFLTPNAYAVLIIYLNRSEVLAHINRNLIWSHQSIFTMMKLVSDQVLSRVIETRLIWWVTKMKVWYFLVKWRMHLESMMKGKIGIWLEVKIILIKVNWGIWKVNWKMIWIINKFKIMSRNIKII